MSTNTRYGKILVVDDEEKIRAVVAMVLREAGYDFQTAKDGMEAIEIARTFHPHLVIVDLQMPKLGGMETFVKIREQSPTVAGIILTAHGTIPSAVEAIKGGIFDYVQKPFDNEQLLLVVGRAIDVYHLKEQVDHLRKALRRRHGVESFVGDSPGVQQVRLQILRIAETDATVLIQGESGTGKELVAKAIHFESLRSNNPLIVVDCAAIPSSLIESEFFGYEKGAFTDARERRIGKFEEADTGSVFLDEIGELPLDAQVKLLRVLQEKEFTRVGGTSPVAINVRVIAATNKNLDEEVKAGRFREDLFYRLNVLNLTLPPLREHAEDIPTYARYFISKYSASFGKRIDDISDEALSRLVSRAWKGNIRQLENVIQRALLSAQGARIEVADLEIPGATPEPSFQSYDRSKGLEAYLQSLTEGVERRIIREILEETRWNRTLTAEALGISRKTLFNKMRQYGIENATTNHTDGPTTAP